MPNGEALGHAGTPATGARSPGDVLGLTLPPVVWLGLFFLASLVLTGVVSLRPDIPGGVLSSFESTLEQYRTLREKENFLRLLVRSAGIAAVVAAATTALAYPVAYLLACQAGRRVGLYLLPMPVPFWTSFLLRVMAWTVMPGSEGAINVVVGHLGLIDEPLQFLLSNRTAVDIALTYVWVPFVALPILVSLRRVDLALLEVAADLQARPWRRSWHVTLPLSLPGVPAHSLPRASGPAHHG